MGSAATLADRSSQPALVWIARQSSSQPETIDPGSSCARNLTGTAMRPLSSTVCRYSPVNTFGSTPDRSVGLGGRGFWGFPTSHHFVPLRCILGRESRDVKMESVLMGVTDGAAVSRRSAQPWRRLDWLRQSDLAEQTSALPVRTRAPVLCLGHHWPEGASPARSRAWTGGERARSGWLRTR